MPHPDHPDPQVGPLLVTDVTTAADGSLADVRLSGELDGSGAGGLDAVLDGLLRAGHRQVVVDLAGLRFLGCAGLTMFVRAHTRAREEGTEVLFTRPTPMTSRILGLTGLDLVLDVRADRPAVRDRAVHDRAVPSSPSRDTASA